MTPFRKQSTRAYSRRPRGKGLRPPLWPMITRSYRGVLKTASGTGTSRKVALCEYRRIQEPAPTCPRPVVLQLDLVPLKRVFEIVPDERR